jgi:hypothetical protein
MPFIYSNLGRESTLIVGGRGRRRVTPDEEPEGLDWLEPSPT